MFDAAGDGVRNCRVWSSWRTVAVIVNPEGNIREFRGEARGTLLKKNRVLPRPMMPYSSIFVPEGHERSFAEMFVDEENAISHRGMAFRQVRTYLEEVLQKNAA